MNRFLLTVILLFSAFSTFHAQTWNFIGGSTGFNASEVDIEISANGSLYMAYVDTDNSNKVTVRKWTNGTWQLVGTAGVGGAGAFEVQIVTTGDNTPAFAAKCMRTAGSTTYESFEIFEWNGSAWVDRNIFGYAQTQHSKGISLCSTTGGQLIFTFYSSDEQANNFPEGAITVNVITQLQLGDLIVDEDNDEYLDQISTIATTATNVRHAFGYNDVGSGGSSYAYLSSNTWNRVSLSVDNPIKVKIERGAGSTNYSTMWMTNNTGNKLNYRSFTGAAANTSIAIATSTAATDFDFDTYNDDTYFFYRTGTTCYFKKLTGSVSPVQSTITSGTALAPANATSLAAEHHYGSNVIAYISSGKCLVKELNLNADIDDWSSLTMCEGSSFTENYLLYAVESNYSTAGLSVECTSTNTSLVPQSSVTTFSNGLNYFGITISSTNDVSVPTTMDIKCVLIDNGVRVDSVLAPLTINPKPNISFSFPATTLCENASPVNLNNLVTPAGGSWTGTGVAGNYFNPSYNQISTPVSSTLTYNRTNNFGCSASQNIAVTVVPAPVLTVSMVNADCNENNGAASVSVAEGMAPYSVYWSNGSTQNIVSQLASGAYYLNVTDGNNCSVNQAVMIATNGVTLSAEETDILCNGLSAGAIDLTVSGGSGNLTYAWSNGATSQDLTSVPAGAYEVVVTDEEGCVSSASYTVTQSQALLLDDLIINQSTCGNDNGAAYVQFVGGASPYSYQWFDGDGNAISNTSTDLEDVPAGEYSIEVTDDNGCSLTTMILISDSDGPVLAIDTIITASCNNDGAIEVANVTGEAENFQWSTGETTQNITGLSPGTYVLIATDSNGCSTVLSAAVTSTLPETVEICLLTVDTLTNTNLVVWEKPVTNGIDHFNIYRETSQAGQYQLAGSVDYDDESVYNDLVASPSVRSWRYKISSVDGCGTESDLSVHHKTIHLTISLGLGEDINLSWDSYEGFAFTEFVIKRHTQADGWSTIQTMPVNLFSFTDTPPSTDGLLYLVTIESPSTCTSTKIIQDFNSSRSNKDARFNTGGEETGLQEILASGMHVYPNPSDGSVSFENKTGVNVEVTIVDATGRMIETFTLGQGITNRSLSSLSGGMYQVIYSHENIQATEKLIMRN